MIATVQAQPGEALDTYIEANAAANGVSLRRFVEHIGFTDETGRLPALWGADIADRHAQRLNDALGIDAHQMTLRHYHPTVVNLGGLDVDRPTTMRTTLRRQWLHIAGSRYCPTCLHEDRPWQTAWKLPWTFACTVHRAWMLDHCPGCQRRPRIYGDKPTTQPAFPTSIPHTTRCPNRPRSGQAGTGRAAAACGTDLAAAAPNLCPTAAVNAQHTINTWLDTTTATILGDTISARDALHTLQAVCVWLGPESSDQRAARPWISPPQHAIDIGSRTQQALDALHRPQEEAAEQLALPLAATMAHVPSARAALRERTSRHTTTDQLADAIAARFERTTTRQRRRATQLLLPLNDTTIADLVASVERNLDADALRQLTGVDNQSDILRDAVTIDVILGHGARNAAHAADLAHLAKGARKRHGYIRRLINQAGTRDAWLGYVDDISRVG